MSIRGRKPRVLPGRAVGLRLTAEERFVIDRIDGARSVANLVNVTGIDESRVEHIVSKLAFDGAVDLGPNAAAVAMPEEVHDGGTTSMAEFAAALGMDPSVFGDGDPTEADPVAPVTPVSPGARLEPALDVGSVTDLDLIADLVERPAQQHAEAADETSPTLEEEPETLEDVSALDDDITMESAPEEGASDPVESAEDEIERAVAERNYRQVYMARWHEVPTDQRVDAAHQVTGSDLLALSFDHDPRVIAAVLENTACGLDHVRLIAFHHRTGTGLEILTRRQDWLRDLLVERRLLRNPMIGELVLGRVMHPKRLFATYKIAIDRDIPELSRVKCRGFIRQKWQTAPAEERADFLRRTEARCLALMTGCTFDAKTTQILCGRPINSAMFVQSIAKFGASPPGLLAHLIKQPFVRKNAALKKMLLAHPNMPGDVKRSI